MDNKTKAVIETSIESLVEDKRRLENELLGYEQAWKRERILVKIREREVAINTLMGLFVELLK